jgi:methyl-accepting chemotaxis protein
VFESIDKVSKNLEKMLSKVNAKEEIKVLQLALSSLNGMKGSLLGEGGVYGKVYLKLTMREKSNQISERLREVIVKQVEKSKEVVTSAQEEQDKAISEVNKVARDSRMFIVGVSSVGVFVGVLFGFWVYRSISKPLRKFVEEMTEIAQGNLTCVSTKFSRDEIGAVRKAMCKMVENISEIVGKLQATTKRVTEHSENLSATASLIEIASTEQEMEIDQAAAAVTEMSHTIQDISNNVAKTADAASKMREKAMKGKEAMWTSMERLKNFIETVRDSSESVESLSQKSEEINNIIALIMKIAEQTKLLALNAGIEAARAGAYGKGFAVVADNIKELSSSTVSATNEISSTINTIQNEISRSVESMVGLRSSIEKVIEEINTTVSLMDEIVGYVEEVAGMVQGVAVALKEQSTAADGISKTVDKISQVTKDLRKSIEEINQAASDFIKIADELHRMASWFKI